MTATTAEVRDEPVTRADAEEALGHLCQRAKREFPVVGSPEHPTPWDIRHAAINRHLTDWQHAAV